MSRIFYSLAVLAWVALLFPYPSTLFIAGCFACFSHPLYARLAGRWPGLRAATAYVVILIGVIIVPVSLLVVLVTPQAKAGYNMLQRLKEAHFQLPQAWLDTLGALGDSLSFIPGLKPWMQDLANNIEQTLGELVRTLVSGGFGFLGGTMAVFWSLFLFVTASAFGVAYAERFRSMVLTLTRLPGDVLDRFVQAIRGALRGVILGILLVAVVQGILCGIGFYAAGVPQPAFWGLLATCVAPIPLVGTAIVWIPLCIVLWFSGSMAAAIGLAIWGAVAVTMADNILRPLFLKRGINAPLFVLVLAILCGMSTFGPVGLVAGPVLAVFSMQATREGHRLLAPPSLPHPPDADGGA